MLPEHDLVILDEAHAFADNATNAFGADLSPESPRRASRACSPRPGVEPTLVDALASSAKQLGNVVDEREGRVDVRDRRAAQLRAARRRRTARRRERQARQAPSRQREAHRAARDRPARGAAAARRSRDDDVVWIEKVRSQRAASASRRCRSAAALGALLLDARPVIAVSATLGGEPPFPAFAFAMGFDPTPRRARGANATTTARTPRPAAATCRCRRRRRSTGASRASSTSARTCPTPAAPTRQWVEQAGDRLCKLVNAAGGRALVLCTSHANVERFAELLRERTDHDVLAQGDADVGRLTRSFIEDETSVLVGTRSFWAGHRRARASRACSS